MTSILGISAFYHDSAAVLLIDGEIIAAAQEERFSRKKHDASFPSHAIQYCLEQGGISPEELDHVGFYEKPLSKFDRLLETYLAYAPVGYRSFRQFLPTWFKEKLHVTRAIQQGIPKFRRPIVYIEHHESHAASAFFPSPFDEAAILTIDGVGEWATTCIGIGRQNRIDLLKEIRFPHSLGLLYSAFTYYLGFRVNGGEYKVMGLAPYGRPAYRELILDKLIDLKDDGSIRMDMSYFNYCQGLTMTSPKFDRLFGGNARSPESALSQREMDLASSIQSVTEEAMFRMAQHAHEITGAKNLVMAGGVVLNCVGNGRIARDGPYENLWVQPAAGDAGGALGTASFLWHQLLNRPRTASKIDHQKGSLLGPEFCDEAIRTVLDQRKAVYHVCGSQVELCDEAAKLIADGMVIGWFQGRMEFGPRALGARSILADARNPNMQSRLNRRIKHRESFRPFAPIILAEKLGDYFDFNSESEYPYMTVVGFVRKERRLKPETLGDAEPTETRLGQLRSDIPAVTHLDYTARVQTVDTHRNPLLHKLVSRFYSLTGCPVMINTSFNVRGEPIVCKPEDGLACFMRTDVDALFIGNQFLLKSEQPPWD